jgi:RNase P/RNase MRP subunit p30
VWRFGGCEQIKTEIMPKRKPRKPLEHGEHCHDLHNVNFDLMVVLPTIASRGSKASAAAAGEFSSRLESQLVIQEIMDRLASTGFTHMALTHTIYGRPTPTDDRVATTIPESLWQTTTSSDGKGRSPGSSGNARTRTNSSPRTIRVVRRLHNIIENLSDVGLYVSNTAAPESLSGLVSLEQQRGPILLLEYDLLSISPRNESVFQSACQSATLADIITLDYTSGRGGLKLPYKIRSSDVKAVMDRNAAFEIPFAPALLHDKQRKALVQTCRELQMASLGLKPRILFSSGDRTFEEKDVGAMALRSPDDLINLMQTVLRFDAKLARDAMSTTGMAVLQRARQRKFGPSNVSDIYHMTDGANVKVSSLNGPKKSKLEYSETISRKQRNNSMGIKQSFDDETDYDEKVNHIDDGFIGMN